MQSDMPTSGARDDRAARATTARAALTGGRGMTGRKFRGIKALTAEAYRAESVTRMVRVQALALSHSSASRSLGLASGALGYWRRVTASREV